MVKRKFTTLMSLCVTALAFSTNVRAELPFAGADGCAVLEHLVYAEVTAAAWYGSENPWPLVDEGNDTSIAVCNRTTRTVSRAYTSAMANIGSPVRWRYPSSGPGDTCLSHYLDQCYPDGIPLDGTDATWMAVRKTVRQAMPSGVATDQSIFSSTTIRRALRFALDEQAGDLHEVGSRTRQWRRQ